MISEAIKEIVSKEFAILCLVSFSFLGMLSMFVSYKTACMIVIAILTPYEFDWHVPVISYVLRMILVAAAYLFGIRRVIGFIVKIRPDSFLGTGYVLQFIEDQTEEMCLEAVRHMGMALRYVKEQTEEICLVAVRDDGLSLMYVRNQTPEICLAAVRQNGEAAMFVRNLTYEIIEAVNSLNESVTIPLKVILKDTFTKLLDSHIDSHPDNCDICFEENSTRMGYQFIPCNHSSICIDCIGTLTTNACPFCRAKVTDVIRV